MKANNDFKGTKGKWKSCTKKGYGDSYVIEDETGEVMFCARKPKTYWNDYPTRETKNGSSSILYSVEKLKELGRYVATKEIREEIELQEKANAELIAAAPELLAVLQDFIDEGEELFPEWAVVEYGKRVLAKALGKED